MINTYKTPGNILAFLKFSRPQTDKSNSTRLCCLGKQTFHTLSVTYNITQNVNHVLCVCSVCVCDVMWKPIWKRNQTLWHNTDFTDHLDKKTLDWKFDQKMHFEVKWTFFFIHPLLRTWFEQHAFGGGVIKKSKDWNWLIWDKLWLVPPADILPSHWRWTLCSLGANVPANQLLPSFPPFTKWKDRQWAVRWWSNDASHNTSLQLLSYSTKQMQTGDGCLLVHSLKAFSF